jgi:hypothetical protein
LPDLLAGDTSEAAPSLERQQRALWDATEHATRGVVMALSRDHVTRGTTETAGGGDQSGGYFKGAVVKDSPWFHS